MTLSSRLPERPDHVLLSVLDTFPLAFIWKGLDGRLVFANEEACRSMSRSLEELVGKSDADLFPPETAEKYRRDDLKVLEGEGIFEDVEEHPRANGESTYVQVMKAAIRDREGNPLGLQAVFWDATARASVEVKALRESEARFRRLVGAIEEVFWISTLDGRRLLYASPAYETLWGQSLEELYDAPSSWADHIHEEDRERVLDSLESDGPHGRFDEEFRIPHEDGVRWVRARGFPIVEEGQVTRIAGLAVDITAERQAKEQLLAAKEAADAANRAKMSFMANMSHEIRTPMNAIIGMTELLLGTELSAEQQDYLHAIRESSDALLHLINDVLDFSKIEAGKLQPEATLFDLRDCVHGTLQTLALPARDKEIELIADFAPDVPRLVIADPARLRQVLVNLVGNAVKFTDAGEVVVGVQAADPQASDLELQFTVSDTGIGIPEEQITRIFDAFEQVDGSITRRFGGTGLGLTICSRLVRLLGGRIWCESTVGRGTSFHFTIRATRAEDPTERARSAPLLAGRRVMVVDDTLASCRALERLLESWQLDVCIAGSAAAAVAELGRSSGDPPDLLLVDVRMPGVNGFQLAEQIRELWPDLVGRVIMMLGAAHRSGDAARVDDLGLAAYVRKPIDASQLQEALIRSLGLEAQLPDLTVESRPPSSAGQIAPQRILLVEDSLYNQKLAIGLLSKQGHEVVLAENGRIAVEHFEADGPFDLILMDVQMPEMDGLEATRAIREIESHGAGRTPIVAMTAQAMEGDRERCLAAGMDAYLAKPVRARDLYSTLASLVERQREGTRRVPTSIEPSGRVDWSQARAGVDGDDDILRAVVQGFLEERDELVQSISAGIAGRDPSSTRRHAHTLKGALHTLGAREAAERAKLLEDALGEGRWDDAEPLLSRLCAGLDTIDAELRAFASGAAME